VSRRVRPTLLAPRGEGRAEIVVRGPRQLEALLGRELVALGLDAPRPFTGGVLGIADVATAVGLCFASRLASRVLWPLARFPAPDADALHAGVAALPWAELLRPGATLAVGFDGTSRTLRHTRFSAQRVKDGVVDALRAAGLERPAVDLADPEVRLQAVLFRDRVTLYLDLAGTALHRRGWRREGGEAPLKETLAAALLLAGGWGPDARGWLVDPLCGSGTLLVEGALLAAEVPPGALRARFGFEAWCGAPAGLLEALRQAVRPRPDAVRLWGRDRDPEQLRRTRLHLEAAGAGSRFPVELDLDAAPLAAFAPPPAEAVGLVATNPPYGERLAAEDVLPELGAALRRDLPGVPVAILAGAPREAGAGAERGLRERLGLPGLAVQPARNGPLAVQLLTGRVEEAADGGAADGDAAALAHAEMFANRVRKNAQRLGRWARREGVDAWRLYDRDLPEYGLVVDRYGDALVVQEFEPPGAVDPVAAGRRRRAALAVLPEAAGVHPGDLFFRTRRRQRPEDQYDVVARDRVRTEVREHGARLLVNLSDYLDTGLYLDSRGARRLLREHFESRPGGRFLNLFAYTGAATVQAALGGAQESTSVDLSRTYLARAREQFERNGLDPERHRLVRADVVAWLAEEGRGSGAFDAILLDPPTFSNSARTEQDLDLQRDHGRLLDLALERLAPDGVLLFVVHARRFRLAWTPPAGRRLEEVTRRTLDPDCARGRPAHRAWLLR
jgi:23S rRNA (guanine2445-N2)-methyltransferase / 23S rRNA (guanine2069-N7)-methyltransferase